MRASTSRAALSIDSSSTHRPTARTTLASILVASPSSLAKALSRAAEISGRTCLCPHFLTANLALSMLTRNAAKVELSSTSSRASLGRNPCQNCMPVLALSVFALLAGDPWTDSPSSLSGATTGGSEMMDSHNAFIANTSEAGTPRVFENCGPHSCRPWKRKTTETKSSKGTQAVRPGSRYPKGGTSVSCTSATAARRRNSGRSRPQSNAAPPRLPNVVMNSPSPNCSKTSRKALRSTNCTLWLEVALRVFFIAVSNALV
mmetsp:Transcript_15043/g.33093  ORF Transcript_15043/g.33093 Transcript_15043/m.33093 type:complete len:260 (+) Transcript_15043:1066-1845(+)